MKFTDAEKISLLMLCDIADGKKEVNPDLIRSAIVSGNTWAISWELAGLEFEGEEDPDHVKLLCDILDMYSMMEASYDNLDDADKARVTNNPMSDCRKFRGFDGNNEGKYLSAMNILVGKLNRYTEFEDRKHLNSHMRYVELYERMVEAYKPVQERDGHNLLSADDLIEILAAARHPERR